MSGRLGRASDAASPTSMPQKHSREPLRPGASATEDVGACCHPRAVDDSTATELIEAA